jgi:hypothetical protein
MCAGDDAMLRAEFTAVLVPHQCTHGCHAFATLVLLIAASGHKLISCNFVSGGTLNTWRSGDDGRPVTERLQVRF